MEELTPDVSREVLKVIKYSYFNHDLNLLKHQIIEVLSKIFNTESLVYFQVDENLNITETILKNLYEAKSVEYGNYFCLMDPFKVIQNYNYRKNVILLEELVDNRAFLSTEYYNDFYRPQNIHYKMVVNLGTNHRLYSTVCLHRSVSDRNFSGEEVRTLKAISPYLVHALEQNELYEKLKQRNDLLRIVEDNCSVGMIILDESLHVLYVNGRAREACQQMVGLPLDKEGNNKAPGILLDLLDDCQGIKEELGKSWSDGLFLPRHRMIRGRNGEVFAVTIQVIANATGFENNRLLMIAIDEKPPVLEVYQEDPKNTCQLTKREMDVAHHIFKGQTNAEIAQALFVSEITVKWHIRNIFKKAGVKNRSALINKLINKEMSAKKVRPPVHSRFV